MSNITTTQHTPTPWHESKIADAIIVNVNPGWGQSRISMEHYGGYVVAESLTEEDRAFVLRACNSCDQLVAALREAKQALASCYNVTDWPANGHSSQDAAIATIEAALAAAGAQP
jgi:hypothetical protein